MKTDLFSKILFYKKNRISNLNRINSNLFMNTIRELGKYPGGYHTTTVILVTICIYQVRIAAVNSQLRSNYKMLT